MATRTVDRILNEWRELERQAERAAERLVQDSDFEDGIAARIEQIRREYREATGEPPEETAAPEQLRLPL
jgi:hypothetical protein